MAVRHTSLCIQNMSLAKVSITGFTTQVPSAQYISNCHLTKQGKKNRKTISERDIKHLMYQSPEYLI